MYRGFVNYLRGQTVLEVSCAAPERVVNLCSANGVPFWNVVWLTGERLRFTTTRDGEKYLKTLVGQLDAEVSVVRRSGAPELWRRVKRRYVLLGAVAVLPLVLAVCAGRIGGFEVSGNDTVSTPEILQALERCGVAVGTRGVGLDQDDLRNRVLPLLPDVVYLAVNVRGFTAHVQVVERTRPPHLYRDSDVQNIVARRDGLVTEVTALDGAAAVSPGDTVTAGQLLISGAADSPRGVRLMRATGTVRARTWYTLTVPIPLAEEERAGESGHVLRLSLDAGRRRIKFYGGGSVPGTDCAKITAYHPLTLPFGLRLPLSLVTERIVSYDTAPARNAAEAAQREGEAQLLHQLQETIGEDGTVVKTEFSREERGGWLYVTLRAECEEQIGTEVPLITE